MWTLLRRQFARGWRYQSTSAGPNEELIRMLTGCMEEEKASLSSNSYKVRAYSKAITTIGQLSEQVRSVDQVKHLKGIGVRIAKRIDAYLSGTPYEPPTTTKVKDSNHTGRVFRKTKPLKTLDELCAEQIIATFSSVSGIGPLLAKALYDTGCKSLQDLKELKYLQMLSRPQQINARYMISSERSVSHEQASAVCDFMTQNISSKYTVLLSGGFRRGASSAQRITLVVLHPHNTGIFPPKGSPSTDSTITQRARYYIIPSPFASHTENKVTPNGLPDSATFSTEIISPLECRGLLATGIAAGPQKWNGIIRVPERTGAKAAGNGWESRTERIQAMTKLQGHFFSAEIHYVPRQCAGAALMALTGDLEFNLAIRRAASQLGFRLNEYGLWRWQDTAQTTGVEEIEKKWSIEQHGGYWSLVAGEKEEDIFEAVGMEWVPPERRNFVNLVGRRSKLKEREDV